jgi:hypothetical protein
MVQRAGADAHQHLARSGDRIRHFLAAKHLGSAVLMELNSAHDRIGAERPA